MNSDFLYQGNSIITVETLPDYAHPVVVKNPARRHPSQRSLRTLENEYQMTRALNVVDGVRQALGQQTVDNQPALILEYIAGQTLRDTITGEQLKLRSKLEIALDLARILGEIHQQHVIHLDLNSQNILIGKDQQAVHIIDLGSASYIDRGGYQKVQPDQLLGTLPYIAPEQTGRINRAVDERSDLYSLGVVLYELMTGKLPFDSKDPLTLVHDHIARIPNSPSEVSSEIPEVLSAIILKLLSKNAEDRYQSATGVQADLGKCLQRLSPEDTIAAFPVGEADDASRFKYPQKLYGRQGDLKILEQAFDSTCRQTSSMIFVGGYSGIGKTALVEELRPALSQNGGTFIKGKFDQYLRYTPYTAISSAFAEFVSLILTEPESAFNQWREEIQSSVDDLGQVLIDIIPALEELIGTQPDIPQLGGQEAENRFNYVFMKFLLAVATEEHPLVLFIDDLQWIDAASLRFLKVIQSEFNRPGFLVIGAYRDNEVDASHPLMGILDHQEETGLPIQTLKLEDLQPQYIEELLADMMRSQDGIPELGTAVYDKTRGNPFFLRRLLISLYEEGRFHYDPETTSWNWKIEDIDSEAISNNVADFLAKRIALLPQDTKNILTLAACIGNRFDLSTLVLTSGLAEIDIINLLNTSLNGQYIYPSGDTYVFVHDQVQQAAYDLIDAEDRKKKHLEIGRLLFANTDEIELDDRIFEIIEHYNLGSNLLTDPAERLELVRLNLAAGRKARLTAAFAASAPYLKQGLTLLGEDAWRDHYRLTLDVHSALIEVSNLNIQYEEVEALFTAITENAKQDVDAGVAYKTLIMSCVARHELGRAISLAERYLERLDVTLDSEREPDLPIAELRDLAPMEDKEKLTAMEILMAITTPVFVSAPERFPSLVYTMLNLTSRYGNNSISSIAYTQYAMVLCVMQRYQEGNHFGQLAIDLLEKYPHPGRAAEVMNMQYANVRNWTQLIHDQITPLKTYHQMAMQAGSFEFGVYCQMNYLVLSWGSGEPLEHCLTEVETTISLCQSKNQQFSLQISLLLAQSVLNLTGRSPSTTQLEGKWFSEETMMSRLEGNQFLLSLYGLLKIKLCHLFGDHGAAYRQTQDVLKYRAGLNPHYLYGKISFYGALSCTAGLPDGESDAERQERLGNLTLFEEELKLWAESAPMNYQHQYDLVMAEKSRVENEHWKAVQFYEKAIKGAQENQFVHDQALANELFAQFWLEQGNDKIAEMYMREARTLYHQWGAHAKVDHLEQRYPQWFQAKAIFPGDDDPSQSADHVPVTITQPVTSIQLDLESITSASQLLAAETDLDQLCTKMISLVMANSGAEKAVLLLKQENEWFVQARKDLSTDQHTTLFQQFFDPSDRATELIPESVFNYCQRTKELLVLGDVQLDNRFAEDRMIKNKIRSITCLPALSQGQLRAMLYLENSQTADVFTLENVGLLQHLSAQFVISVENALLYDNLNQKVSELEVSEAELVRYRDHLEALVAERTNELNERVKELDCLYGISRLAGQQGISLEAILSGAVNLLPSAMQYPEITCARIVLNGQEFKTEGFRETPWQLSFPLVVKGEQAGQVKVGYLEERPEADEGPFQEEDWLLLNAVAERLGRITERKQSEEKIREQNEFLNTVIESLTHPFYVVDANDYTVQVANSASREGGSPGDATCYALTHGLSSPCTTPDYPCPIEEVKKTRQAVVVEHTHLDADGNTRDVEIHAYPIFDNDGNVIRIIEYSLDITERKQAGAALVASEEKYRDLVEKVSDVIYSVDMEGQITYLNPAIEVLIGLTPEQLVGQPFAQFIYPEDLERLQKNVQELLSGSVPGSAEYRTIAPSGETRWIHITSQPIRAGGEITGVQGVLTDITERKQAEERHEHAVAIAERERLARRLHDAVTQTLFSASVIAESTPRIMEKNPDLAERNLDQLSTMLRGALAEMRSLLIELRPAALVGKPLDELIGTLVEANQLRINCPIDLVIEGQGTRPEDVTIVFYRVAQEALSNIIKYAEADEVNIKLTNNEDHIELIVKDNGIGFDPGKVPPGHFGLNIMQERIDQIGGVLVIDSKPGQVTQIKARWLQPGKGVSHE